MIDGNLKFYLPPILSSLVYDVTRNTREEKGYIFSIALNRRLQVLNKWLCVFLAAIGSAAIAIAPIALYLIKIGRFFKLFKQSLLVLSYTYNFYYNRNYNCLYCSSKKSTKYIFPSFLISSSNQNCQIDLAMPAVQNFWYDPLRRSND